LPTVSLLRVLGANSDHDDLERATDDLVRTLKKAGHADARIMRPRPPDGQRGADFLLAAVPLLLASRPVLVAMVDSVAKWAVANRRVVRIKIGDAELEVEGGTAKEQAAARDRFLDTLGYAAADHPAAGNGPGGGVAELNAQDSEAAGP
jgi:hypothetical protein